ncbi:agmatinase [Alicyclobacillus contaminans]|uniref:agmatinase n=1 Tax=Alicyclobacillus contaminans TaxID=392016 RepID=UPI0004249251|nr:agmatinase [Alicyclobacillus contaminans]GMA51051.1 agmatinase [Alicyclobacillus contaminans]
MLQSSSTFLYSNPDYRAASVVLFGVPMDYTVCFRPGARFGPAHIRQASYGLEPYSLQFGDTLLHRSYHDAGDLVLPFGNAKDSLLRTETYVSGLVKDGKTPFALGGEHLISLPIIRVLHEHHPDLHVIHLDAHADLADVYFGESVTHATVMRRVLDFLPHNQFAQFGIRSADWSELEFAAARPLRQCTMDVAEPLAQWLAEVPQATPLYVTVDIDVLDPAFAPGTGTPEAGGISPRELFAALGLLRGRNVVGADLVEVAPQLDASGCTAVLGAKIVREMLLTLFEGTARGSDAGDDSGRLNQAQKSMEVANHARL